MADSEIGLGVEHAQMIVPLTGEVVDLSQPDQCIRMLAEIRQLEAKLREAKSELTFHLEQEFQRQGLKTLEFKGVKAELRGGSEVAWDIEVLEQLRELGLPDERFNDLVKVEISYKVSAAEAKRIAAANEEYAAVIAKAQQRYNKPTYISIKTA